MNDGLQIAFSVGTSSRPHFLLLPARIQAVIVAGQTACLVLQNYSPRSSQRLDYGTLSPLDLPTTSIFELGSVELNLVKGGLFILLRNPFDVQVERSHLVHVKIVNCHFAGRVG